MNIKNYIFTTILILNNINALQQTIHVEHQENESRIYTKSEAGASSTKQMYENDTPIIIIDSNGKASHTTLGEFNGLEKQAFYLSCYFYKPNSFDFMLVKEGYYDPNINYSKDPVVREGFKKYLLSKNKKQQQ